MAERMSILINSHAMLTKDKIRYIRFFRVPYETIEDENLDERGYS